MIGLVQDLRRCMTHEDQPIAATAGPACATASPASSAAVVPAAFMLVRRFGPALLRRPDSRLFKQENLSRAREFFARYGARSIELPHNRRKAARQGA